MAKKISPWSAMTYDTFITLVHKYHRHNPYGEYGQSVMNVLYSIRPDLYNRLCANHLDIFHTTDQSNIDTALDWVRQELSCNK